MRRPIQSAARFFRVLVILIFPAVLNKPFPTYRV
jgi:hypothetical protein